MTMPIVPLIHPVVKGISGKMRKRGEKGTAHSYIIPPFSGK
jgi:hypothetical protein